MTSVDERPRNPGGRPSKLTEDTATAILTSVEQGSYLKVAALAAGVHEGTLHRWLARGAEAQRTADAHEPDRLYCPRCDLDRTDEQTAVDEHNSQTNVPDGWAHRILGPCQRCTTGQPPAPFALPDDDERYREFREELTRAEAKAEALLVGAWQAAAFGPDGDWRAARDLLARRAPERWAGVTRVQMTNEETERRLDDAVTEALAALNLAPVDDDDEDDLPRETENP